MEFEEADWVFAELWNLSLNHKPRTEFEARERIWASELYNAPVDLYLKLKGTNPSNVPDIRSMMKFDAGNKTEFIVRLILLKIGIFKASQTRVMFEESGLLPVSGKIDFEAGGGKPVHSPELDMLLEMVGFPEDVLAQSEEITRIINTRYPNGIKNKIIELKSVASTGMNRILMAQQPLNGHDLQAFHYAYNTGKVVELLYICRDDWRVHNFLIHPDDPILLQKYLKKIKEITDCYVSGIQPALEKTILYDEMTGKFARNFSVQYSSYLTMLYGFKHAEQYADWFKMATKGWNAATGWVAKGKRITPKKEEALKQIEAAGFDLEFIKKNITDLAAKGIAPEEEGE